jgi:hypothetical protein
MKLKAGVLALLISAALAVVTIVPRLSPFASVSTGSVGIVTRRGVALRTVDEGALLKWPLLESVHSVFLRPVTRKIHLPEMFTADGDPVGLRLSLNVRISKAGVLEGFREHHTDVLRELDFLVPPIARQEMRKIATTSLNVSRAMLGETLAAALKAAQPSYLQIDAVLLERLELPDETKRIVDSQIERRWLQISEAARANAETLYIAADSARLEKELTLERLREQERREHHRRELAERERRAPAELSIELARLKKLGELAREIPEAATMYAIEKQHTSQEENRARTR